MFCVPTGAAEQLVAYDYGTIETSTGTYDFTLGVVTAAAAVTGETEDGRHAMSGTLTIVVGSSAHSAAGSGYDWMEVTLSGKGNITSARSTCSVKTLGKSIQLSLP